MRDLLVARILVLGLALPLAFLSQLYFFRHGWRLFGRAKLPAIRVLLRGLWLALFVLLWAALLMNFRLGLSFWRSSALTALTGLLTTGALFAYLGVKFVALLAWMWNRAARAWTPAAPSSATESLANPPRRQFVVQSASVLAGSIPFASAVYGFAFERLRYQVREVQIPIAGLPQALDGLRIAQLSDVHMSSYMSASDVRRAVDMTNELKSDLTVVTGDFITRPGDPLEQCVAELSRLHAPLGVWGSNGNHESYANVEALAAKLFRSRGMGFLRQESILLESHGQRLNLIGIDYESSRDQAQGVHPQMAAIEPLIRRDLPNILLAHNPNCFPRAAELGIELMLTGHTHGGQVTVEILDHRITPARFLTPYVAGMFRRPLGAPEHLDDRQAQDAAPSHPEAIVYVNRGLGTIGMPVRLGVPPEITLHVLRRA